MINSFVFQCILVLEYNRNAPRPSQAPYWPTIQSTAGIENSCPRSKSGFWVNVSRNPVDVFRTLLGHSKVRLGTQRAPCSLLRCRTGYAESVVRVEMWTLGSGSNPYKKPPQSKCNALVQKTRADIQKLNVEGLLSDQYTWIHRARIFDFVVKMVSN